MGVTYETNAGPPMQRIAPLANQSDEGFKRQAESDEQIRSQRFDPRPAGGHRCNTW